MNKYSRGNGSRTITKYAAFLCGDALIDQRKLRGLYTHIVGYVLVMSGMAAINPMLTPRRVWFIFPLLGWGTGVLAHAVSVLDILPWFGPEWERRQVEKKLGRKL